MVQIRWKEQNVLKLHVGMQIGANFTIVSSILLTGLNSKFYEIFSKQHMYFNPNQLPYDKILSPSNKEILCEEHVKLKTFLWLLIAALMIGQNS